MTDTVSSLELARKVLRIEAAAILGLVDRIDGERAILAKGPAPGTAVVTVGATELWGVEYGGIQED